MGALTGVGVSHGLRNFCAFLTIILFFQEASWSQDCPNERVMLSSIRLATTEAKKINAISIEQEDVEKCSPATAITMAVGAPLCQIEANVPVTAMALGFLKEGGDVFFYAQLVDYSPEMHENLLRELRKRYQEVNPSDYPRQLRKIPVHRELTALFKEGDIYVSLERPSRGMPGHWWSQISFEKEALLEVSRRDLNSCESIR